MLFSQFLFRCFSFFCRCCRIGMTEETSCFWGRAEVVGYEEGGGGVCVRRSQLPDFLTGSHFVCFCLFSREKSETVCVTF